MRKLLSVLTLATLLLTSAPVARTQEPVTSPGPPEPPCACGPEEPCKDAGDHWYMPADAQPADETDTMSSQETGGPDDFGYTWDDSVAMNWIDATTGTDTGMSESSSNQAVGPISLPFSFKYYENTYESIYIAASGYLAFTDEGTWPWQPRIPSSAKPNNLIAPYAAPFDLAASGPTNRVYYTSGGTAPNRYFVVEWYQVEFNYEEVYTFEVILYENGDIVFQYQTMSYGDGWACGDAGIEDSVGLDGLSYLDFCDKALSNKTVRFYRPAPSARVNIHPLHQGDFVQADETATFDIPIRNTGDLGADTYDITTVSPWPVSLYDAGGAPLTDSDSNGTVDTGSVPQGGSTTVMVKVETPNVTNVGDDNMAYITFRSSLDTDESRMVKLRTAVPAPFAQGYRDDADGAMSLYLVQPDSQRVKKTTSDAHYGYDMAVAEMPNSFAYVWYKRRSIGSTYVREIEYTLRDSNGSAIRGVSKLTNHSGATMNTYDYDPAVAVAPNGRIGVIWYRYRYNNNYESNYNIYYAILDASGNIVIPPTNLTNDTHWGSG